MENFYQKIMLTKDKPLFKNKIPNEKHKIFFKYTSNKYYKYIYDLLDILCKKCPYENKLSIFHLSLYFILKILYKCENTIYLNNLDLIVLNCFSLGIKSTIKQKEFPSINKIKAIYEEKYSNYKNEEICEGEIICLKLLNYNINRLTAYEYIIYLTQNDSKLKELSLINLHTLMINNLKKFIYISSFEIAKDCVKTIKEKIIIKEPKIIKKKIISSIGFHFSPIIKKNTSIDNFSNSICNYPKFYQINNDEIKSKIKTKKISNININKNIVNTKKSCILPSNIDFKNNDDIYFKKNFNNFHPSSSTSLITESNLIKNNDNVNENNEQNNKKELFYVKLNKIIGNKYIYKNNTSIGNCLKIYKRSNDSNRKKIYLNNNKIMNVRKDYDKFNKTINININMNNNSQILRKMNYYHRNNILKENDSCYINLYNERNDSPIDKNNIEKNIDSIEGKNTNINSFYNTFLKDIKYGIETKNINLSSLNKKINNSNIQRYNISLRKNEKHQNLNSSSNCFNSTNFSQDGNIINNKSLLNYYIHW